MKNTIITIAIVLIVLVVIIIGVGAGAKDASDETAVAEYFKGRVTTVAVEKMGQPIEGFDAGLLMDAYPGLETEDFDGVQTLEGHYEVENGEMSFVRDVEQPISSAERAVSSAGYRTLLRNVSLRLDMDPETERDVDELIKAIE